MSVVWADTEERRAQWDALVGSHPDGTAYLLSWYLAQQQFPRTTISIAMECEGAKAVAGAVLYSFHLPAGQTVCLVPSGPIVRAGHEKKVDEVLAAVLERAVSEGAILIQFEAFAAEMRDVIRDTFKAMPHYDEPFWKLYHPTLWRELRVDLRGKNEETLLGGYSTSTRQRIREAIKKQVAVSEARDDAEIDAVHAMWEAGGRDLGYTIRPRESFRSLVHETYAQEAGTLLTSRVEGELAAFVYAIFHGCGAIYMYGAHHPELAKGYGNRILQYRAMCMAIQHGGEYYSLGGPAESGVREFKMGFRPVLVDNWRFVTVLLRPARSRMMQGLIGQTKWMERAKAWAARALK